MDNLKFINKRIKEYKELIEYYKNLKHDDKFLEDRRWDKIFHYEELLKNYIRIRNDLLEFDIVKNKFADLDYEKVKIKSNAWEIISKDKVLGNIIKRMANGKFYYNHKIKKDQRKIVKKALEVENEQTCNN